LVKKLCDYSEHQRVPKLEHNGLKINSVRKEKVEHGGGGGRGYPAHPMPPKSTILKRERNWSNGFVEWGVGNCR